MADIFSLAPEEVIKASVIREPVAYKWRPYCCEAQRDAVPPSINLHDKQFRTRHLITTLESIQASGKLETVKQVSQRINEVMDYAVNSG